MIVGPVRPVLANAVDGTIAGIVDGPTLVMTDIACTNDVTHVIDRVVLLNG